MPRFKKIYVEITSKCNLNCKFCKAWKDRGEMSISNFQKVVDEIKAYSDYVYLHVKGEPLLHTKLPEILEYSSRKNMKVVITTNATLLAKKKDTLFANVHQINVSLHSDVEKNIDEIFDVCEYLSEKTYINYRIWTGFDQKLIDKLKERYSFDTIPNNDKLANNIYISLDEEFKWPDKNDEESSDAYCLGTINQIGILADGSVVPCCLDGDGEETFGNIFEESLAKILESDKFIKTNQAFKNNKAYLELCKKCRFKDRFVL